MHKTVCICLASLYLALYLQTFIALRSEDTLTGEVYETIILLSQEVLWQYRQI